MEPAHTIITALGGCASVARICGVHRTRPWKWTQPKEKGGAGGIIPVEHAATIIAAGRKAGIEIPLTAFVRGAFEMEEVPQMKSRIGASGGE